MASYCIQSLNMRPENFPSFCQIKSTLHTSILGWSKNWRLCTKPLGEKYMDLLLIWRPHAKNWIFLTTRSGCAMAYKIWPYGPKKNPMALVRIRKVIHQLSSRIPPSHSLVNCFSIKTKQNRIWNIKIFLSFVNLSILSATSGQCKSLCPSVRPFLHQSVDIFEKYFNSHNSVIFQTRSLKFCMEVDLDILELDLDFDPRLDLYLIISFHWLGRRVP